MYYMLLQCLWWNRFSQKCTQISTSVSRVFQVPRKHCALTRINKKYWEGTNIRPNNNVAWFRSPPKSSKPVTQSHATPLQKNLIKFFNNFSSYSGNRQTDRHRVKHILLGGGKKASRMCTAAWVAVASGWSPVVEWVHVSRALYKSRPVKLQAMNDDDDSPAYVSTRERETVIAVWRFGRKAVRIVRQLYLRLLSTVGRDARVVPPPAADVPSKALNPPGGEFLPPRQTRSLVAVWTACSNALSRSDAVCEEFTAADEYATE